MKDYSSENQCFARKKHVSCLSETNFANEEEEHIFDNVLNKHAFNRNKKVGKGEILRKSEMEKIDWMEP